ncbi:MAG: AAA family ATPase, partial [Alphaproteobacteria bacterium]|nr:AAA family ATPase [Alphaproteobacteria bacterium]
MNDGDQSDVIGFLSNPRSHEGNADRVEVMATHASLVFLAGDRAIKLKRAVAYPYLDFSTPELRRRACEAEFALNQRTAPSLYLAVRSIQRAPGGGLVFDGEGPALDWVVVMRRFDQSALLDQQAAVGALTPSLMIRLADHIAAFHQRAETTRDHGGSAGIEAVLAINEAGLARGVPSVFDAHAVDALCSATRAALPPLADLLERRRRGGHVRHCHGDLHLRNICLIDGEPTLFDCLEFDRELACIDVLYDLGFLLMDLEQRGQRALANLVLNRYLDRTGEADGLAAIPFFASLRAAVRAHVGAAAVAAEPDPAQSNPTGRASGVDDARAYLALACALLRPSPPRLVAIGGLSGTGKSTLAAALAPELGGFPGARVVRSDVIRKQLLGVPLEERCPPEGYAEAVTLRVYAEMRREAAEALAGNCSVILD